MSLRELQKELRSHGSPEKAAFLARFFKTGPGEYAEGDCLLGVRVPVSRKVARKYRGLPYDSVVTLLHSKWHEERLVALFILVDWFECGDESQRTKIYNDYLDNSDYVNNWDLVDASAHRIVGPYLYDRGRKPLQRLARSRLLWDRRIAVIATYHLIKRDEYDDTFRIAEMLLDDEEDLIHKAVGWMLREVGNRDRKAEEVFLKRYYHRMPRTMLRYAIENFPERTRQRYLKGTI